MHLLKNFKQAREVSYINICERGMVQKESNSMGRQHLHLRSLTSLALHFSPEKRAKNVAFILMLVRVTKIFLL